MLTVQVDQALAPFGQSRDGRHTPVHVGPGTAVRRYDPGHDDLPVLPVRPRSVPRRAFRRALVPGTAYPTLETDEPGLHDGLDGPRAHQHGVGPAAGEQLDGFYHQCFARPRLAGERRHPGTEHEAEVVDHP